MRTFLLLVSYAFGLKAVLPPLPFARTALEPVISGETIDLHYNKHHAGYVKKLNAILQMADDFKDVTTIIDLVLTLKREKETSRIRKVREKAYNFAAQVLAHNLYWESLSPNGGGEPTGILAEAIVQDFGSFHGFKEQFIKTAAGHFGSGWVSLCAVKPKELVIMESHDTGLHYDLEMVPILTVDVWEHAYYVDYRHNRKEYLEEIWKIVNWNGVEAKYYNFMVGRKMEL